MGAQLLQQRPQIAAPQARRKRAQILACQQRGGRREGNRLWLAAAGGAPRAGDGGGAGDGGRGGDAEAGVLEARGCDLVECDSLRARPGEEVCVVLACGGLVGWLLRRRGWRRGRHGAGGDGWMDGWMCVCL